MNLKQKIEGCLFPPKCPCCLKLQKNDEMCEDCEKLVRYISGYCCKKCGRQIEYCECEGLATEYEAAVSALYYEATVKEAVHNLKFHRESESLKYLVKQMARRFEEEYSPEDFDLATGIPDVPSKKRKMGYTAAQLLARSFCRREGMHYCERALKKVVDNRLQHSITAVEREGNVVGVFEADKKLVNGKRVLVIDDVITTGNTANEAAKMLKIRGAETVVILTAAVTPPHRATFDSAYL